MDTSSRVEPRLTQRAVRLRLLFEVIDRATNRTLYSRGFASICGEWETTDALLGAGPRASAVGAS